MDPQTEPPKRQGFRPSATPKKTGFRFHPKPMSDETMAKGEAFAQALIDEGHDYDSMKSNFVVCAAVLALKLQRGVVQHAAEDAAYWLCYRPVGFLAASPLRRATQTAVGPTTASGFVFDNIFGNWSAATRTDSVFHFDSFTDTVSVTHVNFIVGGTIPGILCQDSDSGGIGQWPRMLRDIADQIEVKGVSA